MVAFFFYPSHFLPDVLFYSRFLVFYEWDFFDRHTFVVSRLVFSVLPGPVEGRWFNAARPFSSPSIRKEDRPRRPLF